MGSGNYMQKPLWDPSNFTYSSIGFNNFMNWNTFGGFNAPIWQSSSTSSSKANTDNESYEDWKKRTRAEREQKAVTNEFLEEQQKEIRKTKDLIEAQSKMIDAVKKGKKSDGNTVVESAKIEGVKLKDDGTIDKEAMKPKKKGFWDKCGEWLSSAGSAVANMGKALICWDDKKGGINWKRMAGFDENGKWRPWNSPVIMTAAAVGACFIPYVGPVIGYGLLAYGVGSAAYGVYKGVKKLDRAQNEEEREQARQDICAGALVGIASIVGLRSLGKSMGTAANASNTATSTAGKITQGISQFGKDVTVNAVKATGKAMQADKALIASNGGGTSGFFKAWGGKMSSAWESFNSWQKRYDNQYAKMETNLNNQIAELNTKIGAERNIVKRTLLEEQKTMLESNLAELRSLSRVKTKTDFDKMRTTNSATKNQEQLTSYTECSRGYEINGQRVSQQRYNTFKSEMEALQKQYGKDLKSLLDTKECTMRSYAKKPTKHTRELDEYTQSTIRRKYNTPEKLKTGIDDLSSKVSNFESKIAELEGKISRTTNSRKLRNLNNQLNNAKAGKAAAETELSVCSSIKFRSRWKPSTWRKNEYQLTICGKNPGKWGEITGLALTSPAAPAYLSSAQWTRDYSVPMFGTTLIEMTPEQTEAYLKQLEQEKSDLEKALENITDIKDVSKWNQLKAQAQAQQEAAQKAAQESAAQQ